MPLIYWPFTIATAIYLINRLTKVNSACALPLKPSSIVHQTYYDFTYLVANVIPGFAPTTCTNSLTALVLRPLWTTPWCKVHIYALISPTTNCTPHVTSISLKRSFPFVHPPPRVSWGIPFIPSFRITVTPFGLCASAYTTASAVPWTFAFTSALYISSPHGFSSV